MMDVSLLMWTRHKQNTSLLISVSLDFLLKEQIIFVQIFFWGGGGGLVIIALRDLLLNANHDLFIFFSK